MKTAATHPETAQPIAAPPGVDAEQWATAIHEAAHGVLYRLLGFDVFGFGLGGGRGFVNASVAPRDLLFGDPGGVRLRMIAVAAGFIAKSMFATTIDDGGGSAVHDGSGGGDRAVLADLAEKLHGMLNPQNTLAEINHAEKRARVLVLRHREQIGAIALVMVRAQESIDAIQALHNQASILEDTSE